MEFNNHRVDEFGAKLIDRVMNYADQQGRKSGHGACAVLIARKIVIPPAALEAIKEANGGAGLFVLADVVALLQDDLAEG